MTAKSRSVTNSVFIIFALMLHAFCAALAVGGMLRVYNMALAYEHSRPEYVVRSVLSLFEEKRYAELIRLGQIPLSRFETAEHFGRAAQASYGDGTFSVSRGSENRWQIVCGDKPVATLSLRCQKDAKQRGDMALWTADRLELLLPAPQSYTVQAPPAVQLTVNGIAPDDSAPSETAQAETPFGRLPDALAPEAAKVYRFDGLFLLPEIAASDANGLSGTVTRFQNSISVGLSPSAPVVAQLSEFGAQAACAYAKYITNDATLDEVLPYFLPESQYYTYLKQFYNGWYNAHEQYAFKNAVFSNWHAYDARHVSCDIAFDYWIKMGRREYTYPSKYTMYFVLGQNGWRVANLVVL